MTPLEYLNQYRQMSVDLVTGIRLEGIDIHEYRNASDYFMGTSSISDDHDVDAGMRDGWQPLSRKIRRFGRNLGTHRYEVTFSYNPGGTVTAAPAPAAGAQASGIRFVTEIITTTELTPVYYGKGSPEAIRKALRYAVAFGLVEGTAAALNRYCTDYIGLDCSGFVGNYLRSEGSTAFGPSSSSRGFAPAADRLNTLAAIRAKSVLCWVSVGHVAIVDSVLPATGDGFVHAMVCESCGSSLIPGDVHTDGLNYTEYVFRSVDASKVFSVRRGIGGSGLSRVHVANLLP